MGITSEMVVTEEIVMKEPKETILGKEHLESITKDPIEVIRTLLDNIYKELNELKNIIFNIEKSTE